MIKRGEMVMIHVDQCSPQTILPSSSSSLREGRWTEILFNDDYDAFVAARATLLAEEAAKLCG